jgi:hypothetical protein
VLSPLIKSKERSFELAIQVAIVRESVTEDQIPAEAERNLIYHLLRLRARALV